VTKSVDRIKRSARICPEYSIFWSAQRSELSYELMIDCYWSINSKTKMTIEKDG
jgi:hypothetical protein